jgi:YebC/PmpR family DNA-binding regulatory protein
MSGHSKWASIKHKKGAADAKRGKIFSKLAKLIMVATKDGGADLGTNFSLRLLVDKAKKANMPKDVIERAIAKGSGATADGAQMIAGVYEAMGPGGAAIVIETLTDNTNRTLGNVKTIISKRGGNFGAKVLWMFEQKGVIRVENVVDVENVDARETLELALIEAGAEDINFNEGLTVITAIGDLKAVVEALKELGLDAGNAGIEYLAKDALSISEENEEKLFAMMEAVEDDDDVTNVYTNAG